MTEAAPANTAIVTLRVGEQLFALPVEHVVEVAAMVALQHLPGLPAGVLGVANRHGAALPMIDLRQIFEQPQSPIDSASLFVVVHYDSSMAGLIADEIVQVMHIERKNAQPATGRYIQAILGHDDRLFHLIDLASLIQVAAPVTDLDGDKPNTD